MGLANTKLLKQITSNLSMYWCPICVEYHAFVERCLLAIKLSRFFAKQKESSLQLNAAKLTTKLGWNWPRGRRGVNRGKPNISGIEPFWIRKYSEKARWLELVDTIRESSKVARRRLHQTHRNMQWVMRSWLIGFGVDNRYASGKVWNETSVIRLRG